MAAKKNSDLTIVRGLNMRDLRRVYAHARQIGWTLGNYGVRIKSHDALTCACQDEFKRRGKKIPY